MSTPGQVLPDTAAARTDEKEPEVASGPSDEALMERFCQGDVSAFDALYARHAAGLRGFFQRMTRSTSTADDLLQVTFLHLVKARGRFAKGERFSPWLYAIARNAARDYLRLARHRFEAGVEPEQLAAASEPANSTGSPLSDAGADPSEVRALREALDQLPENYREAVVLHQLEGLSFAEVARILGSTPGAVKVRAHRGYQRLRELLKKLRSTPSSSVPSGAPTSAPTSGSSGGGA
jgi:RNA polymerase sigma-70 factor (ECF subfamily)